MEQDAVWMQAALAEANIAAAEGETPVGAVLVCENEVLAAAHNRRETRCDVSAHAEIEALRAAGERRGDWRMEDCTLYVTMEPCPMCAGAILAARVGRVVYGTADPTAGAMGSVLNLPRYPLGRAPQVTGGVLADECRALLRDFFKERRK